MKISLEEKQSIASLLNKLTHNGENEIEIAIPFKAGIFDDPENIELLKNHALLSGKSVRVSSPNEAYVNISRKCGIPAEITALETEEIPKKEYQEEEKENSPAIEEPFFQEIEQELKNDTPEMEEFTKRYFDLGPKKKQHNDDGIYPIEHVSGHTEQYNKLFPEKEVGEEGKKHEQAEKEYISLFEPLKKAEKKEEEDDEDDEKDLLQEDLKGLSRNDWKIMWIKIGVAALAVVALFIAYFYLPRATIIVFAQREKDSFSLDIKAKKNTTGIDVETKTIPAQLIQINKTLTQNFEAKEKGSFSEKSRGTLKVYNDNGAPQLMVPSRFESSSGFIYWSQRNIKIPARGSLEIEVVADKPGREYDLACKASSPCQFTVPAWKGSDNFKKIHATSNAPFGGGITGSGFIVSNDDYEKAQLTLRNDLLKAAQQELSVQIPQQFSLLQDSVRSELLDISSNPPVNSLSQNGKVAIKGTMRLQAFLIKEKDLKELVDRVMKGQITKDKETKPDTVSVEYSVANMDFENGEISLTVWASEETAFTLDNEYMKTKLTGKSEGEVRKFLSDLPKVQSANITLWPFWVRKIPNNTGRVDIDIR